MCGYSLTDGHVASVRMNVGFLLVVVSEDILVCVCWSDSCALVLGCQRVLS